GYPAGAATFAQALEEAEGDLALEVELHDRLAWSRATTEGPAAGYPHAQASLAAAEQLGDSDLLADALSHVAFVDATAGREGALEALSRALELRPDRGWAPILGRPDWSLALVLQWSGDLVGARAAFAALEREALDRGDEGSYPWLLYELATIDLLLGAWGQARQVAEACLAVVEERGQPDQRALGLAALAAVDAREGRVGEAEHAIAQGLDAARANGNVAQRWWFQSTHGLLQLSLGHTAEAAGSLGEMLGELDGAGMGEPAMYRVHGDAIEAFVGVGDLDA
ncbi:hypothetical protein B7486_64960, partial [cyanobacterium TDX16]